jgi:hypothetical protein
VIVEQIRKVKSKNFEPPSSQKETSFEDTRREPQAEEKGRKKEGKLRVQSNLHSVP